MVLFGVKINIFKENTLTQKVVPYCFVNICYVIFFIKIWKKNYKILLDYQFTVAQKTVTFKKHAFHDKLSSQGLVSCCTS